MEGRRVPVDGGDGVTFASLVSVMSARALSTRAASRLNAANVGCARGEGWPGWEDAEATPRAESGSALRERGTDAPDA